MRAIALNLRAAYCSVVLAPAASPAPRARGRRTNSPPQFGHTAFIASVHSAQNVHSYVQMYASASRAVARPHRSQLSFINSATAFTSRK
jgi:hypothetical protein